jgi:GxxExxY protein
MDHDPARKEKANQLSREIIGAAIEVHRHLGPGLLESAYQACLCHELSCRQIAFEKQVPLPIAYKGVEIDAAYRIDLFVSGLVIVELKAVEKLEPIYEVQLLTYLRLSHIWLGLLINFNEVLLKDGIKRMILD